MNDESEDRDRQLMADVLEMLDNDDELPDKAKHVVYAAMEGDDALACELEAVDTTQSNLPSVAEFVPAAEPVGAFLKSITVRGFRGVGARATLHLHPAAGLTVVAGRNGSGKSSFSEALELAITGDTYRWREKKGVGWAEHWRNIHESTPCQVLVELAEEGAGATKIGVDWASDAALSDRKTWVQRNGKPREHGTDSLGWTHAMEVYRPILSYDELGGLLEATPSTLFDRLDAILGLDQFTEAQKRLTATIKTLGEPEKQAKAAAKELKEILATIEDERAVRALALLRKREPDLDAARILATGTAPQQPVELVALKSLAELRAPTDQDVAAAVRNLRESIQALVSASTTSVERLERRADLLQQALTFHLRDGDGKCPVCGEGDLDTAWRQRVESELATEREEITRRRVARRGLDVAINAARALIRSTPEPAAPVGLELATLTAARSHWQNWCSLPGEAEKLAVQMEAVHAELVTAFDELRLEAAASLAEREDAWVPVALRLAEWVRLARRAQHEKPIKARCDAAGRFMAEAAKRLRQRRLGSVEDKARSIWAALRQDSNVDLGGIELKGQGTRRHVELHAAVDGTEAQALGVMSQGELHALALALFLPRATTAGSPFRFIVLDDPIQAMDPAKIDGFVRVLVELAKDRQVVVLSHDDRLPQVVRLLGVEARIVEVHRDTNSVVTVAGCQDPAQRYLSDAFALARDTEVPTDVRARVLPGLCRMAVEVAARDRYLARRLSAGDKRVDVEAHWQGAATAKERLALALHGDKSVDLGSWLNGGSGRRQAYQIITKGAHEGIRADPMRAIREVEQLVEDLQAGGR